VVSASRSPTTPTSCCCRSALADVIADDGLARSRAASTNPCSRCCSRPGRLYDRCISVGAAVLSADGTSLRTEPQNGLALPIRPAQEQAATLRGAEQTWRCVSRGELEPLFDPSSSLPRSVLGYRVASRLFNSRCVCPTVSSTWSSLQPSLSYGIAAAATWAPFGLRPDDLLFLWAARRASCQRRLVALSDSTRETGRLFPARRVRDRADELAEHRSVRDAVRRTRDGLSALFSGLARSSPRWSSSPNAARLLCLDPVPSQCRR